MISSPWFVDQFSDTQNDCVDPGNPKTLDAAEPLPEPDLATAQILVAEPWDTHTHTCAQIELQVIHYEATQ